MTPRRTTTEIRHTDHSSGAVLIVRVHSYRGSDACRVEAEVQPEGEFPASSSGMFDRNDRGSVEVAAEAGQPPVRVAARFESGEPREGIHGVLEMGVADPPGLLCLLVQAPEGLG